MAHVLINGRWRSFGCVFSMSFQNCFVVCVVRATVLLARLKFLMIDNRLIPKQNQTDLCM